jgi:NAD(P)-dependent dehydrogenase (short-subunit alcohol dehydrogenase family)
MTFSNNQALIVGGSSGMGLEAGRLLVEAGASVALVGPAGRRNWMLHAKRSILPTM